MEQMNTYSTESQCSDLYFAQYKLHDVIFGKDGNDHDGGWPFGSTHDYVTTDSSQELTYDKIMYRKQWSGTSWVCNSITNDFKETYLSKYKFHKVVDVDPAIIPFKIPIALPIEMKVNY